MALLTGRKRAQLRAGLTECFLKRGKRIHRGTRAAGNP